MGKLVLSLEQVLQELRHQSKLYLLYVSVLLQQDIVLYHCQLQLKYNQDLIFLGNFKDKNEIIRKNLFV